MPAVLYTDEEGNLVSWGDGIAENNNAACCCPDDDDTEIDPDPQCCDLDGDQALNATITNKTGFAVGFPDTLTLTGSSSTWFSDPQFLACYQTYITFSCNRSTGQFHWESVASSDSEGTIVALSCDPFELVFDVVFIPTSPDPPPGAGTCTGSYRITITL